MAMTLRTDDELERALDMLTKKLGLSRQEVVRRAVLEQCERATERDEIEEISARMKDRWQNVLDRLGSV